MDNFIKITTVEGYEMIVNIDQICHIERVSLFGKNKGNTSLHLSNSLTLTLKPGEEQKVYNKIGINL